MSCDTKGDEVSEESRFQNASRNFMRIWDSCYLVSIIHKLNEYYNSIFVYYSTAWFEAYAFVSLKIIYPDFNKYRVSSYLKYIVLFHR